MRKMYRFKDPEIQSKIEDRFKDETFFMGGLSGLNFAEDTKNPVTLLARDIVLKQIKHHFKYRQVLPRFGDLDHWIDRFLDELEACDVQFWQGISSNVVVSFDEFLYDNDLYLTKNTDSGNEHDARKTGSERNSGTKTSGSNFYDIVRNTGTDHETSDGKSLGKVNVDSHATNDGAANTSATVNPIENTSETTSPSHGASYNSDFPQQNVINTNVINPGLSDNSNMINNGTAPNTNWAYATSAVESWQTAGASKNVVGKTTSNSSSDSFDTTDSESNTDSIQTTESKSDSNTTNVTDSRTDTSKSSQTNVENNFLNDLGWKLTSRNGYTAQINQVTNKQMSYELPNLTRSIMETLPFQWLFDKLSVHFLGIYDINDF